MPDDLVRLAERANPRRSFLLVSTVLGKHIPVSAARCRLAGMALALKVADDVRSADALRALSDGDARLSAQLCDAIEEQPATLDEPVVVIGFAETATGLAEQVACALDANWLQTTTRVETAEEFLVFSETHSHAPEQRLVVPPSGWPSGVLVIVDDELTTGATAARLVEVLHGVSPRPRYVIAALVDGRPASAGPLQATAQRLGISIDVVALATREPARERPVGWSNGQLPQRNRASRGGEIRDATVSVLSPPQHVGQDRAARRAEAQAAETAGLQSGLGPDALILGTGEHLAFAQRFAFAAAPETQCSSTTRSPVLVSRQRGYAIRDGLSFANPDGKGIAGYAYNVQGERRTELVVHFADLEHRARGDELLAALANSHASAHVHAFTLDRVE